MFKLESYITPLLMGYLDKYVKLRQEDFQLSLWGGDAVLSNLDLRLDELEKVLQLPVVFQSGHIHELRLHVPWTKLGSEPVIVTINTVECIVKVRDRAYEDSSTSQSAEAAAKAAQQKVKRKQQQADEDLPPGYLQSIVNRIINNVSFVFNNLILKFVEDDIVLSVNIKSAECYSVDRDWNRAFVDLLPEDLALRKVINFADLTVCLDKTNASGHIESYQEPMAYRCAVTCRLHMSYDSVTAKFPKATRFNVYCDTLNLCLTDTQLPMFVRLLELMIAMYYGYLDIPSADTTKDKDPSSSTSVDRHTLKSPATLGPDVYGQYPDGSDGGEGWASWAWSFVPQILPPGEEEDEGGGGVRYKRGRPAPLILSIGFYFHKGNIIFKLTERSKDGSELPHKKMHFHPFLTMAFEGASLEVLIQGLEFCDVQSGMTSCRIYTNGDCLCGVVDQDVLRCNTLLRAGEALSQKMQITYLSNSLFDATSFENQGHTVPYILDRDVHLQTYTEQYGLTKFGAFWNDYLYTFEKPEKPSSGAGSNSSDTDQTEAIFDREFSNMRFLLGDLHVTVSSTFHHRLAKFISCMWDPQYEPYGAGKNLSDGSEGRPKPTEDQIQSLENFIPTQLLHLALINPTMTILTSEHPECNVAKKAYRSRHRKKDSKKKEEAQQAKDLAALVIVASRFDVQITKPMYPGRLIRLVSAIAGPSSNLLHHCHRHTQIKLFGLQAGLQRASANGSVTRPLTLVPPCSFALYFRYLVLPKLWTNSSLTLSEWMFEIPNVSVNINKPSVIMAAHIVSSWTNPKAAHQLETTEDSLIDDLFPVSGESTKQTFPLLEFNLCSLEFKSCASTLVDAWTASLSSVQVVLYTPGVGGKMSVVPIMCGPSNTSQLTKIDFFSKKEKDLVTLDPVTSDCVTLTLQKPKNITVREAPALALLDCQGIAVWVDPNLMGWFHYFPQPRPSHRGSTEQDGSSQQQPPVSLDLTLAHMTSPLNAVSQASVRSTSSQSRTGGLSQPQTPSATTPKGHRDGRSSSVQHAPNLHKKEKEREQKNDIEGSSLGVTFAAYFPLIRALHLQVDMKSSVLFLPKAGCPTTSESCEDLVRTVQQAFLKGWLSPTLVVCLPSVIITSAMSKPIHVLQELPTTTTDASTGSLIGDRLPWTIKLSQSCLYTLLPTQPGPCFLLHPVDVVSTLAVNSTYSPPTSEHISSLALCIHVDVENLKTDLTSVQLHLLSVTASQMSCIARDITRLSDYCLKMFAASPNPGSSQLGAGSPRDLPSVRKSVSSSTHRVRTSSQSIHSGEVTDQVVTDVSEDLSHDSSPLHESILSTSESEAGTKLSLWLQLMLPRVEATIYHSCPQVQNENGVSLTLENLDLCLDSQSVYSKVKLNLSSFRVQHSSKGPDGFWNWSNSDGVVVTCTQRLPRNLRVVSNKLWVSDNPPTPMSFSGHLHQSHDAMGRDKKHGVLSVTLTRALCKNVKKRLKKANVELPSVSETGGPAENVDCASAEYGVGNERSEHLSAQCDPGFFYFHEYLSEICLKTGPVDVVVKSEVVDFLTSFLSALSSKSKSHSLKSPDVIMKFTKESPMFETVMDKKVDTNLSRPSSLSSPPSTTTTESFSVENLPLIYADVAMVRLFFPLHDGQCNVACHEKQQNLCDKSSSKLTSSLPHSTSLSSPIASTTTAKSSSGDTQLSTASIHAQSHHATQWGSRNPKSLSKENQPSTLTDHHQQSISTFDGIISTTPKSDNKSFTANTDAIYAGKHSKVTFSQSLLHESGSHHTSSISYKETAENNDNSDSKMSTTLDHTVVLVQLNSLHVSPHADNPLSRTPQEATVYQHALQTGHAHQPGSSVEDRQYQMEIKGLAISTGCWDRVTREVKHAVTQHSSSGSRVQIPALEWNTFLMDGHSHERREILLAPLASAFDMTLVVAPPIHCAAKGGEPPESPTYLICGTTAELNLTSDLDLYLSNGQFHLLSLLATQFGRSLDSTKTSSSTSSPCLSTHRQHPSSSNSNDPYFVQGTDQSTPTNSEGQIKKMNEYNNRNSISDPHHHYQYQHHNVLGGDSGVESDVSTLNHVEHFHQQQQRGGHHHHHHEHQQQRKSSPTNPDIKSKKDTMIYEAVSRMTEGGGTNNVRRGGDNVDGHMGNKESDSLVSSSSIVDLLVTAGRISVTVYTHKVLEEAVTQELPSFRERLSGQRVRHHSSRSPTTPTTTTPTPVVTSQSQMSRMNPCRDNLEQRLKAVPLNRYSSTSSYPPGELSDEEDNSDCSEEPFTEFNFMKQTSIDSSNSLQKTMEPGTVCMLPYVYMYITQPHCIMSNGRHSHKMEMACYDLLVKGASDSHLAPVEEYHQIPDCADFNVHWLETRAGRPHPYTGIPPSLVTLRVGKEEGMLNTAGLYFERPLRLKLSQLAIEQTVVFASELTSVCSPSLTKNDSCVNATNIDIGNDGMKESGRNRGAGMDEGSENGLGFLRSVERLELSTKQLVIVMETGSSAIETAGFSSSSEEASSVAVGAVTSLEGFDLEVDLDNTENDAISFPSFAGHAHLRDALVKLNYEKKSSPLIGPLTADVDIDLTWIPTSTNQMLPQLQVMLETGVIMTRLGQEHVFCMRQLYKNLSRLYQSLLPQTSSPTATNSHQSAGTSKEEDNQRPSSPNSFVQDRSHDDLRRGGFEYLEEPEDTCLEPDVHQIVFSSHDINSSHGNNYDNNSGDGYMSWRYSHPRVITSLHLTPVPFGLALDSNSTAIHNDSTPSGQTKVQCLLQYYDSLEGSFNTCAQFQLLESEPVTVQLPDPKPHNASQLVASTLWKVVLLQSSAQGDAAVLPVSLAACMCVDSVFIPSLIPTVKASINIPTLDIRMVHHLDYNGTEIPTRLKRFHPCTDVVGEQEFAIVTMDNIQVSASHSGGSDPRTDFKLTMTDSLDILDYTCLAMKRVLDPVDVAVNANLTSSRQTQELEIQIDLDTVRGRVGKNVVHTLYTAMEAWNNFNPACTGPLVLFYHYIICNDTSSVIRFGQSGTDENISLGSREMYAYSWRSYSMAQLLHLCLDQPSWRWTEPFPITQPGVWVREVKAKDQDYAVIVKVTKLSAVQLQVTITGQLLVSNQLSLPISVRIGNDGGSNTRAPGHHHHHHYTLQPGQCLPSMASTQTLACPIQLKLSGYPAPWSHEIFINGDSMKETQMVQIHLPGDSPSFFHIWCRIFCQHFQGKSQKLVMLTPLYVVRTHLPQPLFICMDSPKVKENHQELLIKSQGRDFQLHLQGGDVTHSMAFRLGPNMPMSSPAVLLSTGLTAQLDRKGGDAGSGGLSSDSSKHRPDIEQLCNLQLDTGHMTWPYLDMVETDSNCSGSREEGITVGHEDSPHQNHLHKSTFPNDPHLDPQHDPVLFGSANEQQPSIDLSVQLCEYIPGCQTLLVNVSPAYLVTNVTALSFVIVEAMEKEGQKEGDNEGERKEGREEEELGKKEEGDMEGRRWLLNSGQTISPPLPKDQFNIAIVDKEQTTATESIPLSDKPMDYKRYNEDIGKVLFLDGFVQVAFVLSGLDGVTDEAVFLTVTSDIKDGIRTICIRDSFCISNLHSIPLSTKLLAVPKKCPRRSINMADVDAMTLTIEGKGQQEQEVTPIPRWSVLKTQDADSLKETTLPQESLVYYVTFRMKDVLSEELEEGSQNAWSVPVRIPQTKESVRSTTSLPYIHPLSPKRQPTSPTATNPDQTATPAQEVLWTTHALCITTHYTRGVYNLVVLEDTAPVLVVENLCPFGIQFGQTCDQLRAEEVTIQEQLELLSDLPYVSPGGWCHYTPPAINAQFGAAETISIPQIHFREASVPSQWSSPVQVASTDAFVRLQDFCDIKITMEVIGMVNHLIIRPVSKAEITAKEIRTRLKDGESQKTEVVMNSGNLPGKYSPTQNQTEFIHEEDASKKYPASFSMEVIEKFSEREEIRRIYVKKNVFNVTAGVLARSAALMLQDETYAFDANDIFALHLQDLYFASFPISKNPLDTVSKNCLALSVGYVQLDNQLCGSGAYDFPVVFLPQTQYSSGQNTNKTFSNSKRNDKGEQNMPSSWSLANTSVIESVALLRSNAMMHAQVVTLTDSLWGQFIIDVVDLSVQPCSVYIDDSFVYRLIEEFELFTPSKLSKPHVSKPFRLAAYSRLPQKVACSASDLSQPLRIRTLSVHQIQMLLSVHASLKLFLASDHTPLNLGKFERQSVYSRSSRLVQSMTIHYASAAIFRAGIVVGSLEILGNPTGLVRSISAGVSDLISMPYSGLTRGPGAFVGGVSKGLGSFVRNVSAGMITSMTNFASSMSRNMDRLSLDENHLERQEENRRNRPNGISQGVVQGLTGFGLSLLGAVAGLADQPLRSLVQSDSSSDQRAMSATSTASSLVTGVGKGLVGVLTKPLGGAAELVSQTGQGILQGTGLGHMPARLQPPPSSLQKHGQQGEPLIWSSGFKYAVKVLTSLPSPILYYFHAVTFDLLGEEVKVVLVLTSDLLVVINVEEDAQQQTLSLSELCYRCHGDEDDDDASDDYVEAEENDELTKDGSYSANTKGKSGNDNKEEDDADNGCRRYQKMGTFTLVWTDHYYNNSSLQHQQDVSKKRIAAFIDSTQRITSAHLPPPPPPPLSQPLPLPSPAPLVLSSLQPSGKDHHHHQLLPRNSNPEATAVPLPLRGTPPLQQQNSPSSHQSGQPRSLSDDTTSKTGPSDNRNNTATNVNSATGQGGSGCVKGQRGYQVAGQGQGLATSSSTTNNVGTDSNIDTPQYRFKMEVDWMRLFASVFETAKNRLEGRGFSV